jgi:hypothetical protein
VSFISIHPALSTTPGPPGFHFDVPIDSEEEFRRVVAAAGLHCNRAEDLMYEGEPEVVLRIEETGVEVVFDADGRLSSLTEPMPPST